MKVIMRVLTKTSEKFIYVLLLLALAIFITALIGMQIYGAKLDWQYSFKAL